MDSPTSQTEQTASLCPSCGQKAISGANFCHDCGHLLPAAASEGRKQLTCSTCGQHLLPTANYCHDCGQPIADEPELADGAADDFSRRVACSDGNCIGIIGPDGLCTECGRPHQPDAPHQPAEA